MATLSLPSPSPFSTGSSRHDTSTGTHPHLRAQLGSIHRQFKPLENHEVEANVDDAVNRVSSSFVQRVVRLLENEHEDELKTLLQETYAIDDETVRFVARVNFQTAQLLFPRLNNLSLTSCTDTKTTSQAFHSCS
jgi:hypothetical protein